MRAVAISVVVSLLTAAVPARGEARQDGATTTRIETDVVLDRFTKPLDDETQRTVRALTLVNMLARHCRGAMLDRAALERYTARSRIRETPPGEIDMALAIVTPDFSYFSHDVLLRLCPKIGDLFGPRGILAPGLLSGGSGRPTRPLDPLNPYLPVPMLPHRNGT